MINLITTAVLAAGLVALDLLTSKKRKDDNR